VNENNNKDVCIIGAGIAGLVTAKTLSQDGFNTTIFERDSTLGGTWSESRTYPGLRTNNAKQTYAFSDFPYPDEVGVYPYAADVRQYLESYADNFDIRQCIKFNHEIVNVTHSSDGSDRLTVTYNSTDKSEELITNDFDKVIVCNGVFHTPNIPDIEGQKEFAGRILHSNQVNESTYREGEKVIVIGGGKSAYDTAAWAARNNMTPTLVNRRAQWMAPRYLPGDRIPGDWLMTSRLFSFFITYHRTSKIKALFHSIGKPIVWLWWRMIEIGFRKGLMIPPELDPTDILPKGIEKTGVGGDFFEVFNKGLASVSRGAITHYTKEGIQLDNGEFLKADLVIFATGSHQTFPFLDDDFQKELFADGYLRLYRSILPPSIPNLAFIGQASSFACQLSFELGAHWLSEYFLGTLEVPSADLMNREIDRVHQWAETHLPNRGTEGFIGPFISNYADDLMEDMGLNPKREKNFIREYFTLFGGSRFKGIGEERHQNRKMLTS